MKRSISVIKMNKIITDMFAEQRYEVKRAEVIDWAAEREQYYLDYAFYYDELYAQTDEIVYLEVARNLYQSYLHWGNIRIDAENMSLEEFAVWYEREKEVRQARN